jgi:hypothetical protein
MLRCGLSSKGYPSISAEPFYCVQYNTTKTFLYEEYIRRLKSSRIELLIEQKNEDSKNH